ncbi:MAG TPA: GNAT family N-acetyltransferase [Bacilli bacterium]|nr:GNAT family N-acetyltransferase [Bacilli bacterium]
MALELIQRLTSEQVKELHLLFQKEWWTRGRTLTDVRKMVEHSDLMIGFCDPERDRRLVAFTRVLTDRVYKALLLDLIVDDAYRGQHVGRALMEAVMQHEVVQGVKHVELYCRPEMMPFYERWGFTTELGELEFMRCMK